MENLNKFFKRLFDLIISLLSIILLSPIMIIIVIIIRCVDKGPALFKQERAGKDGKPFILYKFRTMKVDADPFGKSPTSDSDPRLIIGGKFLREYSLDELPQFFNVIKGNMSIVGPRPLYCSQIRYFSDHHKKRLKVKPGITGLSQILLRSDLISKESLDLEAQYAEKPGFWRDLKILFQTFAVVFGKKGVYEK